jgi:hypothetical protein
MTTPATRFYFALAAIAWLGALVYGVGSGGTPIGVVTLGWSGGVGDHLGYSILIGLAGAAFAIGAVTAVLIDLLPATAASKDDLPAAEAPANPAPWPLVGAFGAGVLAIGAVSSSVLFIAGGVVLGIALVEWAVQSWADQATGDPQVNAAIRSRLMSPIEVPVTGVLIIAFVVLGLSRVLLAVSKDGSAALAIVVGVVVLAVAVLIGTGKLNTNVITGLLLFGAVAVLAGGIVGAAVGERDFEHHEPEHGSESGGEGESHEGDEGGEGGFEVNDPGNGVPPGYDFEQDDTLAPGNTPAENTTTTVAAEEGE